MSIDAVTARGIWKRPGATARTSGRTSPPMLKDQNAGAYAPVKIASSTGVVFASRRYPSVTYSLTMKYR